MSTYSASIPEARTPVDVVTLSPSAFATKWKGAPRSDVKIGLTLVSSADVETAKTAAGLEAWRIHPNEADADARYETYTAVLIRWLIARGTSDPENTTRPFYLWKEAPEDIVREALSSEGVKFLWDALDRVWTESSPVVQEIDESVIVFLVTYFDEAIAAMPETKAKRIRRLLGACVDELREFVEDAA
jgi:hypothetical protein